ncbi:asparagine synthase-related protein [Nocardia brasiliensis]|uniref:asparagine synthase-related protein n=1 Tax=Nocardia brasiliensis TaxID=37326 RepID=UPI00245756CE|nr:asparagine synthase-related protein [Nocardia brasiliensis]
MSHVLADQTGDALQYLADLREIGVPDPRRRQLADPAEAATLIGRELRSRVDAVLQAHPGDPVVMLSGGVDSIAVAAAAVQLGARPHAITVVTDTGTDATNAAAVAKALGLTHQIVELDVKAVVDLARESIARLKIPELWEITYAIPLLAAARALDALSSVGPILTGSAADAILAGGKMLHHPVESPAATVEMDQMIRKESASNFRYDRLVPDFYARVLPTYEHRFVHVFQTVRFWEIAETFAAPAMFGVHDGAPADKLCLRIACTELLPDSVKPLAWSKKAAIQRSAGIMGALATGARQFAASMPGAQTYGDPMSESYETVATRLFLGLLDDTDKKERSEA